MGTYVNDRVLADLFADVEMKRSVDDRIRAIASLTEQFVSLTTDSLERIAFELADDGWTIRQIADEINVNRDRVMRMIRAYAHRTGRICPIPAGRRSLDNAVDISRLVSKEARRRDEAEARAAAEPPAPLG